MTTECLIWFGAQAMALVLAALAGRALGRRERIATAALILAAALMVAWPILRLMPDRVMNVAPVEAIVFLELTGAAIPAALFFACACQRLHRVPDRRAVRMMLVATAVFFIKGGLWMLRPPPPDVPSSHYADGVCRQSTPYTCVAASLVTLLRADGIETSEGEMARLSYTEVGIGTTDTRAVLALRRKLAGRGFDVHYERMSFDRLRAVELPVLVPLKWGYFVSHMVPVLAIDADGVLLGDPLTGARRIACAEFEREWLGRGIYIAHAPVAEHAAARR